MARPRELVRFGWTDAAFALLAVATAIEAFVRTQASGGRFSPALTAAALTAVVLPLLARRRFPFLVPALVWILAAALSFVDARAVVLSFGCYLAGIAAAFLLGHLEDPGRSRLGLAIVVVAAALVVANDPNVLAGAVFYLPGFFALAWLTGLTMRSRADRADAAEQRALVAEREREAATRVAVAEERARIARELHDVVAHSVSVMVLQVGAVRHRLPDARADDRQALREVEHEGRAALSGMRRLLGALAKDEDEELAPQPGLGDLDSLADKVRRTGLIVDVRREGEPIELPRDVDLSAYRIVQEGLTNVLKHAAARTAVVTVRYRPNLVELEVADDGVGPPSEDGAGHGLVGIRERVNIYGGRMSADPGPGGGHMLRAELPVDGAPA